MKVHLSVSIFLFSNLSICMPLLDVSIVFDRFVYLRIRLTIYINVYVIVWLSTCLPFYFHHFPSLSYVCLPTPPLEVQGLKAKSFQPD